MVASDNQTKLVAAATKLFSHYGVKKTSMAAIAEEAGLSRQTVYSIFPSKDDIIAASMRMVVDTIKADLVEGWKACDSVEAVLDVYYEHSVLKAYQLLAKSPDLKDLINGIGGRTKKLAEKTENEKVELLCKQLQAYEVTLKRNGTSAESLSRYIVRATTELKFSAKSKKELTDLLATLKATVLAVAS